MFQVEKRFLNESFAAKVESAREEDGLFFLLSRKEVLFFFASPKF